MSLYMGKRIHRYHWDELPIDEHMIERVESMAKKEDQPIMNRGLPCFEWAHGVPINDLITVDEEQ